MYSLLRAAHEKRWANLFVVNLRILIGFAFVPAGLKKVLGQPFTDAVNVGAFHDFLHAFHATGPFYHLVGAVQLAIAVMLMTQTLPTVASLMAIPVLAAIVAFCWSTAGLPTAIVVTLMFLGTVALALWDIDKWKAVFQSSAHSNAQASPPRQPPTSPAPIDRSLWRRGGALILLVYAVSCILEGGVYRPRGVELDNPTFFVLPLIAVIPLLTFAIEQLRRRRQA